MPTTHSSHNHQITYSTRIHHLLEIMSLYPMHPMWSQWWLPLVAYLSGSQHMAITEINQV